MTFVAHIIEDNDTHESVGYIKALHTKCSSCQILYGPVQIAAPDTELPQKNLQRYAVSEKHTEASKTFQSEPRAKA